MPRWWSEHCRGDFIFDLLSTSYLFPPEPPPESLEPEPPGMDYSNHIAFQLTLSLSLSNRYKISYSGSNSVFVFFASGKLKSVSSLILFQTVFFETFKKAAYAFKEIPLLSKALFKFASNIFSSFRLPLRVICDYILYPYS